MSILGIRKKAKQALKNILGFEEQGEDTYTEAPTVNIQEEIIKQPSTSVEVKKEVEPEPEPEAIAPEEVAQVSSAAEDTPIDEGLPLTIENVQEVFDDYIRPGLQSDGGDITLIKIEDNDIYVKLVGACSTCPSSVMTMKMGVEALLQEEFPTMRELVDITAEEGA